MYNFTHSWHLWPDMFNEIRAKVNVFLISFVKSRLAYCSVLQIFSPYFCKKISVQDEMEMTKEVKSLLFH
jgi:hypothetical protein